MHGSRSARQTVEAGRSDGVVVEGSLDALGAGSSDVLVDRECLPQVRGAVAGVAVLEVVLADSF